MAQVLFKGLAQFGSCKLSIGRSLWGTHALWATILNAWLCDRRNTNGKDTDWNDIEFDKLAHCIHLLWNCLYGEGLVSFGSAYKSRNGVHGPGPATSLKTGKHRFALDVINHVQNAFSDNPDVHLFALRVKKFRKKNRYKIKPGREQAFIPLHLSMEFDLAYKPEDIEHLNQIIKLLVPMEKDEIRALGTHQSAQNTLEAIEFNAFLHLFRRLMSETFAIESPSNSNRTPLDIPDSDLFSLQYVAEELDRKSRLNRMPYSSAYRALISAADKGKNEAANVAINHKIFNTPESIWDNRDVKEWQKYSGSMKDICEYMLALKNIIVPPPEPEEDDKKRRLSERIEEQRKAGVKATINIRSQFKISFPELPNGKENSFSWKELRSSIVAIFNLLPGKTPYHNYFLTLAKQYG